MRKRMFRRNPASKGPADNTAARELVLYVTNDSELYRQLTTSIPGGSGRAEVRAGIFPGVRLQPHLQRCDAQPGREDAGRGVSGGIEPCGQRRGIQEESRAPSSCRAGPRAPVASSESIRRLGRVPGPEENRHGYQPGMTADEVKRGLVNHDGYDARIEVRKRR